jgi:O-antigen/teichoic acid export membrane protein
MEVGYYKLAKSLASPVGYLVGPLQSVVYPRLASLVGQPSKVKQLVRQTALSIGVPFGVLVVIGIPAVPLLVSKLVGEAYLPAVFPAQFLTFGMAVWLACFWLRPTYMALGEVRGLFGLSVVAVSINLVGMLIVIPVWGLIGLAFWMMVSQVLGHALLFGWLFLGSSRWGHIGVQQETI